MLAVRSVRRIVAALTAMPMMAAIAQAQAQPLDLNDYPTSARVEYVFGCLKANGETRQAIEQCSCSIDVVASLVPYERYVSAETVLSMSQVRGDMGSPFRTSEMATNAINELRRAQAEAEVRCF
jgi:poly-beta-hydroxyalkanoate depolymerase